MINPVPAAVSIVFICASVAVGWYTFPSVRQAQELRRERVNIADITGEETVHIEGKVEAESVYEVPFADASGPFVMGFARRATRIDTPGLEAVSNARILSAEFYISDDTGRIRVNPPTRVARFDYQSANGSKLVLSGSHMCNAIVSNPRGTEFPHIASDLYNKDVMTTTRETVFINRWIEDGDTISIVGQPSQSKASGEYVFKPGDYILYTDSSSVIGRLGVFVGACIAMMLGLSILVTQGL